MNAELIHWANVLVARFPEFVCSTEQLNPDLPYDLFGSFAVFICARIGSMGADDLVIRAFDLINEMAEVQREDVDDLIVAGFLEVVGDHDRCRKVAQTHLVSRGKELLEGWIRA